MRPARSFIESHAAQFEFKTPTLIKQKRLRTYQKIVHSGQVFDALKEGDAEGGDDGDGSGEQDPLPADPGQVEEPLHHELAGISSCHRTRLACRVYSDSPDQKYLSVLRFLLMNSRLSAACCLHIFRLIQNIRFLDSFLNPCES